MTSSRLIHILGGGPWQVPTVRLAKALGYRVLVTDMYADRPAYALADMHEVADITDRAATLRAARQHRIDGILCDTTDIGVPTAAYVAEQLGLPGMGYETALNCTNKWRMRQLTEQAGLAVPRYRLVSTESALNETAAALGYPVIVKPVDNQSGRGVSRVGNRIALGAAFALAKGFSRAGEVLIEECLSGVEIIVDGFVVAGVAHVLGIAYKTPYPDAVTVSSRIHYPGGMAPANFKLDKNAADTTLSALGLCNGVFHAEFMLRGSAVIPIDIAARGGGVKIYTHVIPHVSGVDVNRAMIRQAMGESIRIEAPAISKAANIEFMRMPEGSIAEIVGVPTAAAEPGVAAIHFNVQIGDAIGSIGHKDHRPGYVVALADMAEDAIDISIRAKSQIRVRMAGSNALVPVT